jgi:hypothetical protein
LENTNGSKKMLPHRTDIPLELQDRIMEQDSCYQALLEHMEGILDIYSHSHKQCLGVLRRTLDIRTNISPCRDYHKTSLNNRGCILDFLLSMELILSLHNHKSTLDNLEQIASKMYPVL